MSNLNPDARSTGDASLAVSVKVTVSPRVAEAGPLTPAVGATLSTVTVKVRMSLNPVVPLSVTRTVMVNEPGPSAGVHVNAPVAGSMLALAGAPGSRL